LRVVRDASTEQETMRHLWTWLGSACVLAAVASATPADAATITVNAGGSLQTAINTAQPGDTILLQAGATFTGNFTLPAKSGTSYITIRSAAADSSFPGPSSRIDPRYASLLPKIRSANTASALTTAAGAHHWRLQFLEFQANSGGLGEIIRLGSSSATSAASQAHHIVIDRVYIHGDARLGIKRGIALNSGDTTIINSYISDVKTVGQDSQAICGWNGPGPYRIENNYLEAAGENVMFGGSTPAIPNLVPSNITLRRNHFTKNLAWRNAVVTAPKATVTAGGGGTLAAGTYGYRVVAYVPCGNNTTCVSPASAEAKTTVAAAGSVTIKWAAISGASSYRVYGRSAGAANQYWTTTSTSVVDTGVAGTSGSVPTSASKYVVKNLLEVKNGRTMLVEGNVFEYAWAQDQKGYAILFTPANNGSAPWTAVQDVTFQYNTVRHVGAGMQINGRDTSRGSEYTRNVVVRHNLFFDVSTSWGGPAGWIVTGNGTRDVTIDHNTVDHSGFVVATTGEANAGFVFTNNLTKHNQWGIYGDGHGAGFDSIRIYFTSDFEMRRNVMAGGSASKYPADNFFPPSADFTAQFVNRTGGDYRLATTSLFRSSATDGTDIGANIVKLLAVQSGS
jgi:hypothetical protein